jgi:membrane protein DedA with SNARE-associated domain
MKATERHTIEYFEALARHLPVDMFVLVGTFIEEVISPIPSFVVLIPAGAVASAQSLPLWYLLWLAALCGAGRVAGGSLLYWLAYRLEGAIFRKRTLFGVTRKKIDNLSKRLGDRRKIWRVWLILFTLHSLPVFPGTLLSAGSGFIKIEYRVFATATFFGSIVNALFYLLIGYTGIRATEYLHRFGALTDMLGLLIILALVVWFAIYHYQKRKKA